VNRPTIQIKQELVWTLKGIRSNGDSPRKPSAATSPRRGKQAQVDYRQAVETQELGGVPVAASQA
jgi:hypothetical protein